MSVTDPSSRYSLLCQSTRTTPNDDALTLRLAPHLAALRKLLNEDLRALGRQGSPDDFADICFELSHEFERFEEFCAYPALSKKFVVAFGGGFSAGKSSLINALLGKRLLVTEVDPTTALPTYLLAGEQDAIRGRNLFGHLIELSDEEFLSLTHDEVEHYGSNISRLLQAAFITRQEFPWNNLALIDTPGYSRHEDRVRSERTDEHIARTQLNSAQAIVWVIDARQGGITEEDLKFLATLRPEIPRLVVVSRADQKPAEDIQAIVNGIRNTLEMRNVPFVDIVAVSSRNKAWPTAAIVERLNDWNRLGCQPQFAHNFHAQFTRYMRFLEGEEQQATQHLNRLNRMLALVDESGVQKDALEFKKKAELALQTSERLHAELDSLRQRFFTELKIIGDSVGIPLEAPSRFSSQADGFDLLEYLAQRREALGKPSPETTASLLELSQPGEIPRVKQLLEGARAMDAHIAAKLDAHCRQNYARFLVAVVCDGVGALTDDQSRLFLKILESLELPDMRPALFGDVQELNAEALEECERIVVDNGLANCLFFDVLMLCRCGGGIADHQIRLITELGAVFGTSAETIAGMPVLAGYVSGTHAIAAYAAGEILDLIHWHPVFFEKFKKKYAKSCISGYFKQKKEIYVEGDDVEVTNAVLICEAQIIITSGGALRIRKAVLCTKSDVIFEASCDHKSALSDSLICSGGTLDITSSQFEIIKSRVVNGCQNRFGRLWLRGGGIGSIIDSQFCGWEMVIYRKKLIIEKSNFDDCGEIAIHNVEDLKITSNKLTVRESFPAISINLNNSYKDTFGGFSVPVASISTNGFFSECNVPSERPIIAIQECVRYGGSFLDVEGIDIDGVTSVEVLPRVNYKNLYEFKSTAFKAIWQNELISTCECFRSFATIFPDINIKSTKTSRRIMGDSDSNADYPGSVVGDSPFEGGQSNEEIIQNFEKDIEGAKVRINHDLAILNERIEKARGEMTIESIKGDKQLRIAMYHHEVSDIKNKRTKAEVAIGEELSKRPFFYQRLGCK